MAEPEVVVAVMYPAQWDPPADRLAAYLRDVAAVSPRIRIVDERYSEPGELRQHRGQNPDADLRGEAPEVTSRQREVLAEAEVVLTQDLPFDVVQLAPRLRWVQGMGAGSQLISAGLPTSRVRLTGRLRGGRRPETAQNRDMFDAKFFAAMPAGAVFVNVGRGSAVVEDDLVAALSNHRRAAALDVVRQEPLPADSPLWAVSNLFISPHSAAAPDEHWANVFSLFADNLGRYLRGEPLLNEWTAGRSPAGLGHLPLVFNRADNGHTECSAGSRAPIDEGGRSLRSCRAGSPSQLTTSLPEVTCQPSQNFSRILHQSGSGRLILSSQRSGSTTGPCGAR